MSAFSPLDLMRLRSCTRRVRIGHDRVDDGFELVQETPEDRLRPDQFQGRGWRVREEASKGEHLRPREADNSVGGRSAHQVHLVIMLYSATSCLLRLIGKMVEPVARTGSGTRGRFRGNALH